MRNEAAGVAIAGAGLIGTSIAWRLAQSGVPVTLFDAGRLGGEASSAGAGMLSPGGEFDAPSTWLTLGLEAHRMYPALVEELRSESRQRIDFRVCGCTQILDRAEARRRADFQTRAGIRVEEVSGGLFYPDDGLVDPVDLLRALRCACEARKVRICELQPAGDIESGDYAAVVIAAGAWSDQIRVTYRGQPVKLPGVVPVKGHLIGFDLEPGTLRTMQRRGHTYVLQRSSGFTIAGSNEEEIGFDRTVDPAICDEIHRQAAMLVPALDGETPSKRWIGFRPRPASGPHIGRVDGTNVWLAYGHYRNGILLAPLTARRVASEIASYRAGTTSTCL